MLGFYLLAPIAFLGTLKRRLNLGNGGQQPSTFTIQHLETVDEVAVVGDEEVVAGEVGGDGGGGVSGSCEAWGGAWGGYFRP